MLTLLNLFRPPDRRKPRFDINDPRHPFNAGWRRIDAPEGRPVRFRITVGEISKPAPLRPELTNREYMGGFR